MMTDQYLKNGGVQSDDKLITGFVSGFLKKDLPIEYTIVNGFALYGGYIVLGTAEEMAAHTQKINAA